MEWSSIFNTAVSGIVGAIAAILVARYSKTKHQRDVEVAKEYLSLAGITAEQLEQRINLIGKLDADIRKTENENDVLRRKILNIQDKQADRDEQMEAMSAQIVALQAQIDKDARERHDLEKKLTDFELRNRVLWKYLIALLEQMRQHRIKPVDPPKELKSDPEIIKLLGEIEEGKSQ